MSDFFGALVEGVSSAWQADKQADMADHSMDFTRDQTQLNRDFQERMRSTQYQTAVGDMQKAGLNPMLAYHQGGAGTPAGASGSGSMGSVQKPDIMSALATAAQADNIRAQTEKTRTETRILEDEFDDGSERDATGGRIPKAVSNRLKQYMGTDAWYKAQHEISRAELTNEQRNQVIQEIKNAITRNKLDELDVPKAINRAKAEESEYMKNIAPYTGELGKITNSAGDVGNMLMRGRMNRYIIQGK